MNQATSIVADVNEAAHLLETYQLTSLMWRFEDCPLAEVKHYVPKGKEELVVVCDKNDDYIPNRLVFESYASGFRPKDYIITLNFHPQYHIFIILNPEGVED